MARNTHYNNETIQEVRKTDMIAFFSRYKGFSFKQQGVDYRCLEHNSLVVKADKIRWFWNSKGIGGSGVIDYLMKIEGMDFQEAVGTVKSSTTSIATPKISAESPKTPTAHVLSLPDKVGSIQLNLIGYLCKTRGIDSDIAFELIKQHKIYEDKKGNVIFLGHDETGKPKFASIRGTNPHKQFRMDCAGSDKRYGFHMTYNETGKLYIFEAPIDAMSHATLENIISGDKNAWKNDNRLSLGGVTSLALDKYLEIHKQMKELVFCLDNDNAGREAAVTMARKYTDKGYLTRIELPQNKDFNEDLIETAKKIQLEKAQKTAVKMHNEMCI